jgi:hypothetical protein
MTTKEIAALPEVTLRPFTREDFGRLISWVRSQEGLAEWCADFLSHNRSSR